MFNKEHFKTAIKCYNNSVLSVQKNENVHVMLQYKLAVRCAQIRIVDLLSVNSIIYLAYMKTSKNEVSSWSQQYYD